MLRQSRGLLPSSQAAAAAVRCAVRRRMFWSSEGRGAMHAVKKHKTATAPERGRPLRVDAQSFLLKTKASLSMGHTCTAVQGLHVLFTTTVTMSGRSSNLPRIGGSELCRRSTHQAIVLRGSWDIRSWEYMYIKAI
jgi:hypothetical protein